MKRGTNIVRWTAEEDQFLRENYGSLSIPQIAQRLGRSTEGVSGRRRSLGLKTYIVYWSDEDIEFLKNNYPHLTKEQLEKELKRTWHSIVNKAFHLGVDRLEKFKPKPWTPQEDETIKKMYASSKKDEIVNALPGRTWNSITARADSTLKVRRDRAWTREEDSFLRQYYFDGNKEFIESVIPDKRWTTIMGHATQLGLKRKRPIFHSQRVLKMLLDKIFPGFQCISPAYPDWLKNPDTGRFLELDIYYPDLNVAFEYNGAQHYKVVSAFFSSCREIAEQQLAVRQHRDKIKEGLCSKNGTKLVVVKYTEELTLENIKRLVQEAGCELCQN